MKLKQTLEKKVKTMLKTLTGVDENYEMYLFTSARSALFSFFLDIDYTKESTKILIPDYVCNVVERSIRQAGYNNIIFYKIDDNLLPFETDLYNKIIDHKPDIVVLAPIFGSYGERYYNLMKKIHEFHPMIILDFAQELETTIPPFVSAAITSFNKKSINGFFGGVLIINKEQIRNYQINLEKLSLNEEFFFLKLFFSTEVFFPLPLFQKNEFSEKNYQKFDYSFCRHVPYRITNKEISIISLVIALWEIKKIKKYMKIREKNFTLIKKWLTSQKDVTVIETDHIIHSPYIPIKVGNPETISSLYPWLAGKNLKLKFPYGKDSNPDDSEKRNLFAIESGFKEIRQDIDKEGRHKQNKK
jgi:dTDP-4-amino-4,6-dideoxygalactose transaminase